MTTADDPSERFGADQADIAAASLIDVRRPPAFGKSAHMLPTAVWRDPAHVEDWARLLDPAADYVVYCVYGHEVSRSAALRLHALGLKARFLRGGIDAWQAAGLPLVDKGEAA